MLQQNDLTKLLKKVYSNSENMNTWLQNPEEMTKEWKFDVDSEKINTVKATIQYISDNLEQVQEVRYVNQYTIKKINEATRHGIVSFYTMMTIQLIAFILAITVFCVSIYAFFQGHNFLGMFMCFISVPMLAYFLIEKPLQDLNQNIGNLVQMQVALGSWFNEMTYWQIHAKESSIEEKQMIAQTMRDATKWSIMLIEDYTSHSPKRHETTKRYSNIVDKVRGVVDKWKKKEKESPLLLVNKEQEDKTVEKSQVSEKPSADNEKPQTEQENKEKPQADSQEKKATDHNEENSQDEAIDITKDKADEQKREG